MMPFRNALSGLGAFRLGMQIPGSDTVSECAHIPFRNALSEFLASGNRHFGRCKTEVFTGRRIAVTWFHREAPCGGTVGDNAGLLAERTALGGDDEAGLLQLVKPS